MPHLDFVFAVHSHQPVGNFEHVFEDAHRRAYRPLLSALERQPAFHAVLHQSGILWEWMEQRHPEALETIAGLIARGQVEILGGPYYEALLPAIPEHDRRGQIDKLTSWIARRFGAAPRGAWVPERVWEPQLAASLAAAGIEYVLLDDTRFVAAGIAAERLDGPWIVTDAARALRVFPIRSALREAIPFRSPDDVLALLWAEREALRDEAGGLAVFADDSEKLGVWPGTATRCWEEGWVDRFMDLVVDSSAWLRTSTLADCADRLPARGRAALGAGAYADFDAWTLSPALQRALPAARQLVGQALGVESAAVLVHGGTWRDFLERYPEAQWLHQRVLGVSEAIAERVARDGDDSALQKARDEVWKAQCNCAYWHGLFGGIYAPHLRAGVRGALLRAERHLAGDGKELRVQVLDVDADGRPEVVLRSRELQAFVKPDAGGSIVELDDRLRCFDLLDLVARRPEAEHRDDTSEPLPADSHRLGACIDRVVGPEAELEDWAAGRVPDLAPLVHARYDWTLGEDGVRLATRARLALPGAPILEIVKTLRMEGAALDARWELGLEGATTVPIHFGIEMAVDFLAGDAPDRYFEAPEHEIADRRLRSSGMLAGVRRFDVVDEWLGLRARFEVDPPCDVWRAPVETETRSEAGTERVYQGSRLLFIAPLVVTAGERAIRSVRLVVERS